MIGKKIKYDNGKGSSHSKLLSAILQRVRLSETSMSSNYTRWQENEKYYMLYKEKTDRDRKAREKKSSGDVDYESVVMPYSYAMLLTAHTYMVNVFLNRPTVFQSEGLNGQGADKETTLDSLMQYQVRAGDMEPSLMVWLLDPLRYGIGIAWDYWDVEYKPRTVIERVPEIIDGVETGNYVKELKTELIPGYEGNKVFNVLPYDFLPDPRVALSKLNDGEFVGRKMRLSWNDLVRREKSGEFFNVQECRGFIGTKNENNERSDVLQLFEEEAVGTTDTPDGQKVGDVDVIEMVVSLIPSEWGLSSSEYPEKWVFTVVDKKVIVGCSPLGYYHDRFPCHVLECEVDGYKQAARSLLEVGKPMNDTLTWLFNTHMYNKRQVINNQFVVDPSRVVMKDLTSTGPGKMIRLKATAYGQDVRSAVSQLPVSDVTMQNYQDAQVVEQQMQRALGINDDISGRSSPSSRRSATEFRGTTSQSANRLANLAYYFSITGWRTLGRNLISTTQQMYTVEKKVKIAGDAVKGAQSITVTPEDIAGEFDICAVDGSMPIDRMSQAQFWMQVLQMTAADPQLQMEYRRSDIFSHMARLAGLKGIDRFKIKVVSDDEIVAMVKDGLLKGANNAGNGTLGAGVGNQTPDAAGAEELAAARGLEGLPGYGG